VHIWISRILEMQTKIYLLRRLVRTHAMHYLCDLFLGIRQRDWQAGVAVAIWSWTVSLTRVNTPFSALEVILPSVYLSPALRY
jgi:hypothetical protein